MSTLVPIPWQPHLFLTPHTLSYLTAASRRAGHNLYLYDADWTRISPAWRSTSQQLRAWLLFRAGKGPVASSPYTGQRNHMRGAAFDLRETSKKVRDACKHVGLIPDTYEDWHWNDPLWRSMPIIPTNTATAAESSVLLPGRTDMPTLYRNGSTPLYALAGDSPGTTANWLETEASALVKSWAKAHGNASVLTPPSFQAFKSRYLEPVKVKSQ